MDPCTDDPPMSNSPMQPRPLHSIISRRAYCLIVAGFSLVACANMSANNAAARQNLERRATFDLNCPSGSLDITPIQFKGDLVTSYGVRGCGQQATYVLGPKQTFNMDPDTGGRKP